MTISLDIPIILPPYEIGSARPQLIPLAGIVERSEWSIAVIPNDAI